MKKEIPGATSPWAGCDKILRPEERFTTERGFLWAPRNVARLAALLYQAREEGVPLAIDENESSADVMISTRALTHIETVAQDRVGVEAGCSIADLDSRLQEEGVELGWSDWVWSLEKATLGAIVKKHATDGAHLANRSPFSRLLGMEGLLWDGSVVKVGSPVPGGCRGPGSWRGSLKDLAAVTYLRLALSPRPQKRLILAWKSDELDARRRVDRLQHATSTWERLDLVCSPQHSFVLAQVAGTEEELAHFSIPDWKQREQKPVLSQLARFVAKLPGQAQIGTSGQYLWHHYKAGFGWTWN